MKISVRIFLGYFVVVGLAAWFVINTFSQEVKPGVRQATEETLVDAANLLAEFAAEDVKNGTIADGPFARRLEAYAARNPNARIYHRLKNTVDYRVYITNATGKVIYDSEDEALGQDFSQWRDVRLTLRGEYGARSTRVDPADERTSVMHVAAPIRDGNRLIGVLTVAKPTASVQPFIDRSQRRVLNYGVLLLGSSLVIGLAFTFWLTRSVNRLVRYATAVADGVRVELPPLGGSELSLLGRTLETMRERLEGKQYVERYVQTLTHEMKSPLTSIIGTAELLEGEMPPADRQRFLGRLRGEAERLRDVTDRMLCLAAVEHRQGLRDVASIDAADLVARAIEARAVQCAARGVTCANGIAPGTLSVRGERFLLEQALGNLLDNAIAFSPVGGRIEVAATRVDGTDGGAPGVEFAVRDHGPGIPDYAVPRVFGRFFCLPAPDTDRKGTGLGLPFVAEVATLHGGSASVTNHPEGGATARLRTGAG